MKSWMSISLAICIGASLLLFIQATDLQRVISSIHEIGFKFLLLLLITFIAYFFGTLSWQCCMGKSARNILTGNLFLIRHIGETVSLINPASILVGESVKIYLLKNHHIDKNTAVASILVSRALMIITQLLLFTTAVIILTASTQSLNLGFNSQSILFFTLIFIAISLTLFRYRQWFKKIITKTKAGILLKNRTAGWRSKMQEIRKEILSLLQQHKKQVLFAFIFATLHWLLGSLEFFFILKFLGIKVTLLKALLVDMGVIFFKSAGAFIPGQIGIEEYGNKIMLAAIGIPGTEIWVTASILRRARQLIWIAFGIGMYWLLFKKQEIKNGDTVRHP